MSRPNRVLVPVELDKTRQLRLNLQAVLEIKKRCGIDLFNIEPGQLAGKSADPEFLGIFVWACCLHEDPFLTLEDVMSEIDFEFIEANPGIFFRVLQASRGKAVETNDRPLAEPPAAPSTGLISGPSEESISS